MSWTVMTSTSPSSALELITSDTLITPPAIEPIDLDEVKKHLRFTPTSEDTLIDTYIAMARQYFEELTGRQLLDATWEYSVQGFPSSVIELPHPPLIDVVSVKYDDSDDVEQTIDEADYTVHTPAGPYAKRGTITPVASWPSSGGAVGSVRIRYRAGYGTQPGDVPELIKGALYFLTSYFHQFRSDAFVNSPGGSLEALPIGAHAILRPFKYSALPVYPALRASV